MLTEMERRGLFLLSDEGKGAKDIYRGILELASRFGFLSIEEVIYGFDLSTQKANDRLKYLVRVGLLERFESFTTPASFYCLSPFGAQMVAAHRVSDEIVPFRPWQYNAMIQRHDRTLIRIYLALRKIFPGDLKGWVGERRLRQTENLASDVLDPSDRRILDGLFQLRIEKERFLPSNQTTVPDDIAMEMWWCGLELELTLKSAERYRKQFKGLTKTVYDSLHRTQKIPLMLFLCGTPAITQALKKYRLEQRQAYGQCLFLFGQVDEFLNDREAATLIRCLGSEERSIRGHEMNRVRVTMADSKVSAPKGTAPCL